MFEFLSRKNITSKLHFLTTPYVVASENMFLIVFTKETQPATEGTFGNLCCLGSQNLLFQKSFGSILYSSNSRIKLILIRFKLTS